MGNKSFFRWFIFAILCLPLLSACGSSGGGAAPVYNGLGTWTWISGSNIANTRGVYGIKSTAASSNLPGARQNAVSWTDTLGNRWLLGGYGYDSQGNLGFLNDIWEFNTTLNQWMWVSGPSTVNITANYGTINTPAGTNLPGARGGAVSWYDGTNLWLFGGFGYDTANLGILNDLWKFDGTNWTWVSGAATVNAKTTTVPGARELAVSWIDASKTLWLFGGNGYDSAGSLGYLNDLWKFSTGTWTQVNGSTTVANATGVYGTINTPAGTNVPGSRYGAVPWYDGANSWLFGGTGYDTAKLGILNDLWKFDGANWTWVSGANTVNNAGIYGSYGTVASTNVPGSRRYSISWIDATKNLWLYGGDGYDSNKSLGYLNDLWKFNGTNWTWYNGSSIVNAAGNYGTLGIAASTNVAGARGAAVAWYDGTYKLLWLFGGYGRDATGTMGFLSDLWEFQP
ncbi:MAG TPA: kelch repeat-containing protein [Nitrospiria bacterium]|nr:kelch repeat-containing protein [Nitrospiria bacterium]